MSVVVYCVNDYFLVPVRTSGEILLGDLYRLPVLFSDEEVTSGDHLFDRLVVLIVHGFILARRSEKSKNFFIFISFLFRCGIVCHGPALYDNCITMRTPPLF